MEECSNIEYVSKYTEYILDFEELCKKGKQRALTTIVNNANKYIADYDITVFEATVEAIKDFNEDARLED